MKNRRPVRTEQSNQGALLPLAEETKQNFEILRKYLTV